MQVNEWTTNLLTIIIESQKKKGLKKRRKTVATNEF